jgi:ribonuclease HIII
MKICHAVSSNVSRFAWENDTLYIEFGGKSVYRYDSVPERVFNDLFQAESVGKFFHAYIKKDYTTTRVTEDEARTLGFDEVGVPA